MRARRFFSLTVLLSLIAGLMVGGVGSAQAAVGPFAMTVKFTTDVDAVVTALLSTHPSGTPGPSPLADSGEDYTTALSFGFGNLNAGTTYFLALVAPDRKGGATRLERTFTTQFRVVKVELYEVKVLDDADQPGRGEITAFGYADDNEMAIEYDILGIGDHLYVKQAHTSTGTARRCRNGYVTFETDRGSYLRYRAYVLWDVSYVD